MARPELTDDQIEQKFFKKKAVPVAPIEDASIDQPALAAGMEAMRDQATRQRDVEDAQLAHAAQAVGGALMARLHKNFSHAAEVNMFMQVRELPLAVLRRIPISKACDTSQVFEGGTQEGIDKACDTSQNLEDFCLRVFGRSYRTMAEEAQNLDALGEQAYEIAARLNIGKRALRVTRALPPEKLEIVRAAIGNGSTKAEVLSVIEDLAEKVQQAESATAEAKAELKASEDMLAAKNKTIDKLQREIKRIEALPPDEQAQGLMASAQENMREAQGLIGGTVRASIEALLRHHAQHGSEPPRLAAAGMVGQLIAELTELRDEFDLPELKGDTPAWQQWAEDQDGAAPTTN